VSQGTSPILVEFVAVFELDMLHPTGANRKTYLLPSNATWYSRNSRDASKKLSSLELAETLIRGLLFTRVEARLH
jgi:hypothetical protein